MIITDRVVVPAGVVLLARVARVRFVPRDRTGRRRRPLPRRPTGGRRRLALREFRHLARRAGRE
ncbi:hypothetical protein, partial [Streptomyces sp. CO7]